MNTQSVFSFLEEKKLLVPFLKNQILQDLTKEELLCIVEKLLNPNPQNVFDYTENNDQHADIVTVVDSNVVINHEHRIKSVKLSLQEVYDRLVEEGITSRDNYGKCIVNKIAVQLGLIEKYYCYGNQARYNPTSTGKKIGITKKDSGSVWYSLTSYDEIKSALLNK